MRHPQRGTTLILVLIGLLAVLAMAGLALDTGHLVLNKARLQNGVDAAALTAAKVLDQTTSTVLATAAASTAFDRNAANDGELAAARGGITLTIEYSNTLQPFVAGTTPARYARVRATNFSFAAGFARVVGFDTLATAASAVAGPTPLGPPGDSQVCDFLPLLACGDAAAGAPGFGIAAGQITVLKIGAGGNPGAVGPGNFQLLDAGSGASAISDALAGKPWRSCASVGDSVTTDPGNKVGPIEQGFNTRFGGGNASYPPDVVTTPPPFSIDYNDATGVISYRGATVTNVSQIGFSHDASYVPRLPSGPYDYPPPAGAFLRREIAVPIGQCTTAANGKADVRVLGFGCFFLLQPTGHSGHSSYIVAEHIGDCPAHGNPGSGSGAGGGPGPYVIQLYRDYASDVS